MVSKRIRQGRFPANLLVSDDVLNDGIITTSRGARARGTGKSGVYANGKGFINTLKEVGQNTGYGDTGEYSRYFSLDAWYDELIKTQESDVSDN